MKTQSEKQRFIELRGGEGLSYQRISKELGVSKQTLIKWAEEHRAEIANLSATRQEELLEAFAIAKKNRLELIGEVVKRLKEEFKRRSLEDVSSDRLCDLLLKYCGALSSEGTDLRFRTSGSFHLETEETDSVWHG